MEKKTSLDDLPEPIIQHILSFLPENYAAKTCILSKAWLSAWRTKPTLDFDFLQIFFENFEINSKGLEEIEERRKKFSKYVKRTLKRYTQQKISIETLKLDSSIYGPYRDYLPVDSVPVERCTRVAVEKGVKILDLSGSGCADELPQIIVGAKSLVDLSLDGFNMLHLSNEKIMWHSLKRLCLWLVYFDEAMFDNVISSCPLLEILKITDGSDNVHLQYDSQLQFKVIDHHNLKQLIVSLFEDQRLILAEAPKLESFICCHLDGGVSLLSSQYQNLNKLTLSSVGIFDEFFNNLEQKFPQLQDLSVIYCRNLRRIKISSQSLRKIQLEGNYLMEEAHFDVPRLELLYYICIEIEIIPEFSFSTATKGRHWISIACISWSENVDSCWFLQLKKFLSNLFPSNIFLNVSIEGGTELDMNEIRNSVTFGDEPQDLQELSLSLSPSIDSSSTLSALDCLFRICRPKIISQYWERGYGSYKLTKLVFDMIMLRTNQDEHIVHHKLQQHDLIRQVKFQIYECHGKTFILGRNRFDYSRSLLALEQPEALDWESILKACIEEYSREELP